MTTRAEIFFNTTEKALYIMPSMSGEHPSPSCSPRGYVPAGSATTRAHEAQRDGPPTVTAAGGPGGMVT
jgi:hypothetical protein